MYVDEGGGGDGGRRLGINIKLGEGAGDSFEGY